MKLNIDGREVQAKAGESLLDMITKMGLRTGNLSDEPLAAKIAGDVFTLNYIPLREKDVLPDRESKRRAMAASGGKIRLLRYSDAQGRAAYTRTSQFVLFLAVHELWRGARATMRCTLGTGLYIKVTGADHFSVERLRERIADIISRDIVLNFRRIPTGEAIALYTERGQTDKARLLSYRTHPTLDVYEYGDFADYFYGEMMPSTGYLQSFAIEPTADGFVFVYPDASDPTRPAAYREMEHYYSVYSEGIAWGNLMGCRTVADLNEMVDSGQVRELIRVNEALHEKKFSQVADMICARGARAVMLAGPSSSGKTTSANRLATQLRVHGKKPILMSLDDYYIDRDKIAPGQDGKVDLEHINTIDTALFGQHLRALLAGEQVEIPCFNFKHGKREWHGHFLQLDEDSVVIVEGLHALNPVMLPEGLAPEAVFKLFVCPLLPLNLDLHNRIPSSYLRLLRRIVRDYESRGASVSKTLSMWESVRAGEAKWIFPFQEQADVIFNSSTLYELAVLKKHIFPLLVAVEPDDEYYEEVRAIVKVLNFVHSADVDDEIPPTSLVREFIGGNSFYR
ncbi:MAG: nucleoside kinase [Clostridia bacterium]|nr:nucleoside kinase [Clostridia bacterium]